MASNRLIAVSAVVFFVAAVFSPLSAQVMKNLDFDSDGVIPSVDSDIVFINPFYPAEESAFSVAGGLLVGNNLPSAPTYVGYSFPGWNPNANIPAGAGMTPGAPFEIEMRARVLDVNDLGNPNNRYCAIFVHTGNHVFISYFTANAIRFRTTNNFIEVPVDVSQFHTVRIVCFGGGRYTAYVDGVLAVSNAATVSGPGNGFQYRLSEAGGAHAEVDYIHFSGDMLPVSVKQSTFGKVKALYR